MDQLEDRVSLNDWHVTCDWRDKKKAYKGRVTGTHAGPYSYVLAESCL